MYREQEICRANSTEFKQRSGRFSLAATSANGKQVVLRSRSVLSFAFFPRKMGPIETGTPLPPPQQQQQSQKTKRRSRSNERSSRESTRQKSRRNTRSRSGERESSSSSSGLHPRASYAKMNLVCVSLAGNDHDDGNGSMDDDDDASASDRSSRGSSSMKQPNTVRWDYRVTRAVLL